MKADLHIHSQYSNDGELGIRQIIKICRERGVDTFTISDHNTIGGSREASRLLSGILGVRFIPGIEIDCNYKGTDLHLLGFHINIDAVDFDHLEKSVAQKHMDAVPRMISNLKKEGLEIDVEELFEKSGGKAPSAELIGELLLMNPAQHSHPKLLPYRPGGERSDMPLINFYLDFFAQGKSAYVKIDHLDFKDALALVRDNGGIPIVAHPGLNFEGSEELVVELMDKGAEGLEVFNNYHNTRQAYYFAGLTLKRGALMTCGSDFHGKTKPRIAIGQYRFLESYRGHLERSLSTISMFTEKRSTED